MKFEFAQVSDQEVCQSSPAAHLWQDAYRECRKTVTDSSKIIGDTVKQYPQETGRAAVLGVGATACVAAAVVAESPVIIAGATLGAIGCGGLFIWSAAEPTLKKLNGR